MKKLRVSKLVGRSLDRIEVSEDKESIRLFASDGDVFLMAHQNDCCEHVRLIDVTGDLDDLLGTPLLRAYETTTEEDASRPDEALTYDESFTWTFYHFATIKGYVTLRWLGESNGYYSEGVDFFQLESPEDSEELVKDLEGSKPPSTFTAYLCSISSCALLALTLGVGGCGDVEEDNFGCDTETCNERCIEESWAVRGYCDSVMDHPVAGDDYVAPWNLQICVCEP